MGRGSSWSSLDLETLGSYVSSGKSAGAIAMDRGWPSGSVRQRVAALKRGDPAPRCVGGVARRLTPELLDEIRAFIEEEHGRIASHCLALAVEKARRLLRLRSLVIRTVPRLQDHHIRDRRNFAEEMLERLALACGRRFSRKINESTSGFGRDLSIDTRRDVACPRFVGFCARFKVHRLCHLVLSQHIATDVSSNSMAHSRDKMHSTRHHPIHAQNFTIRSHSTAQVPCLCSALTCSDVTIRPPCCEIFAMEGHMSTISQLKSSFWCPTYQVDVGVPFSTIGPTYQCDTTVLFLT